MNGRGVPSIAEAKIELFLSYIHRAFRELVNPGLFDYLIDSRLSKPLIQVSMTVLSEVNNKTFQLFREIKTVINHNADEVPIVEEILNKLKII